MNFIDILGIFAGCLTTGGLVPQLIQIIKSKSTKDISLGMFLMFSTGIVCWLIYGILIKALPIVIANSFSLLMSTTILFYKLRYK